MTSKRTLARLGGFFFVGSALAMLAAYGATSASGRPDEVPIIGMILLTAATGLACALLPWQRWPRRSQLGVVPLALALAAGSQMLTAWDSETYGMFFVVIFTWVGISQPRWTSTAIAPLATAAYLAPAFVHTAQGGVAPRSVIAVIPIAVMVGESLAWVTDRLALREETYSSLVEASPDAILVHVDERIAFANPAALQLLGATDPEQLLGRSVFDILSRGYHDVVRERIAKQVSGQSVPMLEEELIRLDGTTVEVEVAGMPLRFRGKPAGQVVFRDISERKRAERMQAESHRERAKLLARFVRAREAERSAIAGGLHDDTVQVLTAVTMRMEMIRRSGTMDPESMAKLERDLQDAVRRMRGMIFELHPRTLEHGLEPAINEWIDREGSLQENAPSYAVDNRLSPEPPPAVRSLLYRIAQEALRNSRTHARASRVTVILEEREGGIHLSVADDGRGFEIEGDRAASPLGHLGLTSMNEQADMAGGWRRVESSIGAGTTVSCWLPLPSDEDPSKAQPRTLHHSARASAGRLALNSRRSGADRRPSR